MNSVGNLLREQREARGMSIDDAVNATKIQKVYLDAIERGDFSFFKNQEFYQQVFVGSYADFLGLNKGEILSNLQDDAKEYANAPKAEATAQPQMDPNVVKKYLQDYDVKSEPKDPVATTAEVNDEIITEQQKPEVTNDEINQLIDEINQNVEVDLDEYFEKQPVEDQSTLVMPAIDKEVQVPAAPSQSDEELLNSSIFEDIQKINDEVEVKDEFEVPTVHENPTNNFFNAPKSDELETTAVIDLTSGIEIETVSNEESIPVMPQPQLEEAPVVMPESVVESQKEVEDIVNNIDDSTIVQPPLEFQKPVEEKPVFSVEEINKEDNINILDKSLQSSADLTSLNEDPSKTSMDLKVAKALGDSKVSIDEKDAKKIKRDRIVDYAIGVAIAILICYLAFLIWQSL